MARQSRATTSKRLLLPRWGEVDVDKPLRFRDTPIGDIPGIVALGVFVALVATAAIPKAMMNHRPKRPSSTDPYNCGAQPR